MDAGVTLAPSSPVVAPNAEPPAAASSDEALERALAVANSKLEECRTQGLARTPRLSGRVLLKIRVAADGHVEAIEDRGSTIVDKTLVGCFSDALRGLRLPADASAYEIVKSYTVLPPPDVWPTARDAGPKTPP
jgi:hypothetical protein